MAVEAGGQSGSDGGQIGFSKFVVVDSFDRFDHRRLELLSEPAGQKGSGAFANLLRDQGRLRLLLGLVPALQVGYQKSRRDQRQHSSHQEGAST